MAVCEKCSTEMKPLYYDDTDMGHYRTSQVYKDFDGEPLGKFVYCPKCGQIKINFYRQED